MTSYDMDPDGVTRGINRLRAAGETFGSAWEGHKKAIDAAKPGIGSDILAQAFLSKYRPLADEVTAKADSIPKDYGALCDESMCCVTEYLGAESGGTGVVNRLTGARDGEPHA